MISHDLSNTKSWRVTNDSVMGGVSSGHALAGDKCVNFLGTLSTDNSGGFTSVFNKIPLLPSSTSAVTISIKGDGKTYQFRVRTVVSGYELAYKVYFQTQADVTQKHTFLLSDFEASHRGRTLNSAPPLKAETISHIGFLLSAKVPCEFSLMIYSIDFY